MEVFISNISYTANKNQVTLAIADILHSRKYSGHLSDLLNFDVRLFPNKRRPGHGHSGSGTLTLPTEALGIQFLRDYGEGPMALKTVSIGHRALRFEKSRKAVRPDIVEAIRRLPYLDPNELEKREKRAAELRESLISIRTIQFGWECRDSVFSVEWEKDFVDACSIFYKDNPRELRIKHFGPSETRVIAVRFSQISWAATSLSVRGQPTVFLSLQTPPSYEREMTSERAYQILASQSLRLNGTVYDIEPRQRLSAFDDEHALVAPYASLAIRLICRTEGDVLAFRRICREAQILEPSDFDYPVEYRGLFSARNLNLLQQWLQALDFEVAFQVESLIRSLIVDVQEMLDLRADVNLLVETNGVQYTSALLRHFSGQARMLFWGYNESDESKETLRQCFQRSQKQFKLQAPSSTLTTENSVFDCLHVIQTPTTIYLEGPFAERSNRVTRSYPGHHINFLRVSFADETRLQYRFDRELDGRTFIQNRVGKALLSGISVAGRSFQFLAYSQSALKEHAVWFVVPFYDDRHGFVDAPAIIKSIGSFVNLLHDPKLIYCPARYGARISQAFTATDSSISVEAEEIFTLDDVEVDKYTADGTRNGTWCFTDGVGTISRELARAVWKELQARTRRGKRIKTYPRALQVRFMGSKGMLSVDYKLSGRAICLRQSMIKFDAPNSLVIEIARAFDKPGKYFLNRPLIMLLEGLGVPYETFKIFQDIAVREAQNSTESLEKAARFLDTYGLGTSYRLTSVMLSLLKLGFAILHDSYFQQCLEFAVHHVLRELKQHARIPIPGGWTLVGVADVHGFLKEHEIFACLRNPDTGKTIYLEGPILISRSPTIHPGDVQVVHAIGKPPPDSCFAQESLLHTVVFSIRGDRPLPSYLGGGDLDGDIYNLIPLNDLPGFRPVKLCSPALYNAAPKKMLDRPSTMADVADFFVDYINSDVLGVIAISWLIIADQSTKGIFDPDCLRLGDLHSNAVDYPKSGQPVLDKIPRLKSRAKPDWNAPETVTYDTQNFYESKRAIGQLFRSIDLPAMRTMKRAARNQRRQLNQGQELTLEEIFADFHIYGTDRKDNLVRMAVEERVQGLIETHPPNEEAINYVSQLFNRYTSELRTICATHTLSHGRAAMLTEEEAMIGTIVDKCSQPRRRKDLMAALREQTNLLVTGIREDLMGDEDFLLEDALTRAWVAWEFSAVEEDVFGAKSFGWLALGGIFEIIKDIEERDGLEGSRF